MTGVQTCALPICTLADSLVEAVQSAAQEAARGDVVLLSPACSSFDQFQNYKHRGEVFRQAVRKLPGADSDAPENRAEKNVEQFAPGEKSLAPETNQTSRMDAERKLT